MLHSVKGKVVGREQGYLHLDVGPFVVQVLVPQSFSAKTGTQIQLYTSMFIREESIVIYGFREEMEKQFFHLALTVPGVGPKLAISLLGAMSLSDLAHALQEADMKALQRVAGVGKKLAQRLVGDLKDKMGPYAMEARSPRGEAVEILVDLGLSPLQAQKCVEEIPGEGISVNELVNESLKKMGEGVR